MRKTKIDEISLGANDLATTATELLEFFNSSREDGSPNFDVSKAIHGTDISYADCVSRIVSIAEIADKFGNSKHFLMVPANRINQLKQRIAETQTHLDTLGNQFRHLIKHGGGFHAFNYDNFHLQTTNGESHDLRGYFKNLSDNTETLLDAFYLVLTVLRPTRSTYSFQAAANALSSLIESSSEQFQNLREENKALRQAVAAAKDQVSAANGQAKKAKEAAEETSRTRDEGAKDRKTIGEYLADATEKKAAIETAHTQASSLEDEVEEYREKFKSFDRQLEGRNNDFEQGKEKQEKLFTDFERKEKSVESLIEKSESMLKGATVAGLASSFSDAHAKLGNQLFWARVSFYVGITFLFISAIPLMLYVFLPILAPFLQSRYPEFASVAPALDTQGEMSGWQYLGQVMARFIILLPAAWLVSFSAIRHSSLFRLREHYAYKYSMAVSVEGFRKQAAGYESEIAALVLEQLAFNPADKLTPSKDIPEGKVPHPLLNILVEKFRKGLDKDK
jgi:predicted  nucleic acid-binding Zn-ribbon protein